MKAREVKKMMLNDYDNAIKDYRSTISCHTKRKDDEQTYIRTLEEQLHRFFGIEIEFDFTNID